MLDHLFFSSRHFWLFASLVSLVGCEAGKEPAAVQQPPQPSPSEVQAEIGSSAELAASASEPTVTEPRTENREPRKRSRLRTQV
jgi:hypothetical protein